MTTTIAHSTGTIEPAALRDWEAAASARSIVHTILGRTDPDITIRPTGLRSGSLTLVFASGATAYAARTELIRPQMLTLVNSDIAQVTMSFIVAGGDIGEVIGNAGEWTLSVPFQEVAP